MHFFLRISVLFIWFPVFNYQWKEYILYVFASFLHSETCSQASKIGWHKTTTHSKITGVGLSSRVWKLFDHTMLKVSIQPITPEGENISTLFLSSNRFQARLLCTRTTQPTSECTWWLCCLYVHDVMTRMVTRNKGRHGYLVLNCWLWQYWPSQCTMDQAQCKM